MSVNGEYKRDLDRHRMHVDTHNGEIMIEFYPQQSVIQELNIGDRIEFRMHRDRRNDDTVLHAGALRKAVTNGNDGYIYELEKPPRETIDHGGTKYEWITTEDMGKSDILDPVLGEWLEYRIHRVEKASNVSN